MKTFKIVHIFCALIVSGGVLNANAQAMNFVGSAQQADSDIQLTNSNSQAGAAWLTQSYATNQSFSVKFSYSLSGIGSPQADGVAFAIQNKGTNAVGGNGGNIGFSGIDAVGSVIQTWQNSRVGLNTNGDPYNTASFSAASQILGNFSSISGTETVSYNAATHMLSMTGFISLNGTKYNLADEKAIDLASKYGQTIYLGFVGGTGGMAADQRITSFSVTAVPEPESYAMLAAGLGILAAVARRKTLV